MTKNLHAYLPEANLVNKQCRRNLSFLNGSITMGSQRNIILYGVRRQITLLYEVIQDYMFRL
jgi:hypothetical protein